MQLQIGPHLEEIHLEQYSMGSLPEGQIAAFEEHLLACEACQDRLLEMDTYINAVQTVSPLLRKHPEPRIGGKLVSGQAEWAASAKGWARDVMAILTGAKIPVMAGGVAAVALFTLVRSPVEVHTGPASFVVALEARRGIEGIADAKSPAGKPLLLRIDLTELPSLPAYFLEAVDR
ncbi:MAG: hypothetical protein ABIZ80_12450, partial [Bryobacteraceae bacterium]